MKYLANEIVFLYDIDIKEVVPCVFNKSRTKIKTIQDDFNFGVEILNGYNLSLKKDGKEKVVNYITIYTTMEKLKENAYIPRDINNKIWQLIVKFNYDLSRVVVPDYLLENQEFCKLFLVDYEDLKGLLPSIKELLVKEKRKNDDYLSAKRTIKLIQEKGRDF